MSVPHITRHLSGFVQTARLVEKELRHLESTRSRLFQGNTIDANWVSRLEERDVIQDTLEAFASRFSRLQETIGDKLLSRLFLLAGAKPGTLLDNLNRAERLGLIDSAANWLPLRALRNKLIHEYVESTEDFADALNLANQSIGELRELYRRILVYARDTLLVDQAQMPDLRED